MIFRYLNLDNNGKLSLLVKYKDEELVFVTKSLFDKTKKYNLDSPHQFELLEEYLEHKGDEFKDEVWSLYKEIYESSIDILGDSTAMFTILIKRLLRLFYVEDIKPFILTLEYVRPPASLKEKFDENIVKGGIGTRVQTYTKDEYINLIALSVISKAIVGPFGEFLHSNPSTVILQTKELSLVQMIMSVNHIMKADPTVKLIGGFERLIETTIKSNITKTVLLSKMISVDDLKWYLLGITLFKIMPVNMPRFDKTTINLITFIYSSTKDNIKPPVNIRQKVARSDGDDTESSLEIYRMSTDIMVAYPEEFAHFAEDPHTMLRFYDVDDKAGVLDEALAFLAPIRKSNNVDIRIVKLLIWVISITPDKGYKDIGTLDPEAIFYLDLDSLVNILAVGFTVLHYIGFTDIALLLTAIRTKEDVAINSSLGNEQIDKNVLERLNYHYPIQKKIINKDKTISLTNIVSKSINDMVADLYQHSYRYLATSKYLGRQSRAVDLPDNLRTRLGMMLIKLHEG